MSEAVKESDTSLAQATDQELTAKRPRGIRLERELVRVDAATEPKRPRTCGDSNEDDASCMIDERTGLLCSLPVAAPDLTAEAGLTIPPTPRLNGSNASMPPPYSTQIPKLSSNYGSGAVCRTPKGARGGVAFTFESPPMPTLIRPAGSAVVPPTPRRGGGGAVGFTFDTMPEPKLESGIAGDGGGIPLPCPTPRGGRGSFGFGLASRPLPPLSSHGEGLMLPPFAKPQLLDSSTAISVEGQRGSGALNVKGAAAPPPPSLYVRGNVIANSSSFGKLGGKPNLEVRTQFEQDETEDAVTNAATGDKNAFRFVTDSHFLQNCGLTSLANRNSITQPDAGIYPASFGISQTCGGRKYQEDFYSVHVENPSAFFVFDGHGGDGCARAASEVFLNILLRRVGHVHSSLKDTMACLDNEDPELYKERPTVFTTVLCSMLAKGFKLASTKESLYNKAITSSVLEFDQEFVTNPNTVQAQSGATLCGGVITDNTMHAVNVGDSRLLAIDSNGNIVLETVDHKVTAKSEVERLAKINAETTKGGTRLNNLLASRLMGHRDLKTTKEWIGTTIATPDVTSIVLPKGATIICATDGLWDHFSSADVAQMVHKEFQCDGATCASVAKTIIEKTLEKPAGRGGHDNITVIIYRN